jgi:hypothetical protein
LLYFVHRDKTSVSFREPLHLESTARILLGEYFGACLSSCRDSLKSVLSFSIDSSISACFLVLMSVS